MRVPTGLQWTHSRRALEVLITNEKRGGSAKGGVYLDDDYRSNEQRLLERLQRLSLDMCNVAGDGNCQFRSISNELFGTQDHHMAIRRKAVAHMRENRDAYECFLGEDFELYCVQMARSGTWGDELTLRAVCDSYGLIVHVVTSNVDNWYITYEPEELKLPREIFVVYIAPCHYNSIRRQSSLKTMALTMGRSFKRLSSVSSTQSSRTVDLGDLQVSA